MASLSAAQLQQKHSSLEGKLVPANSHNVVLNVPNFSPGAPDPFPSLYNGHSEPQKVKDVSPPSSGALDSSENAFPTLAPSSAAGKAPSSSKKSGPSPWSAGGSTTLKKALTVAPVYSSNFTLPRIEANLKDRDGKPLTLGSVMKDVMAKTKTKIEASSQRTTGGTTFMIKGDNERSVEGAIRSITAALSPQVC
jgi:hypothetical protein